MERRVKERLVGATILVALVVLFVPEFLSGPHRDAAPADAGHDAPARTYTIDIDHIDREPPAAAGPSVASAPPAATAPSAATPPAEPPVAASAVAAPPPAPVAHAVLPPRPAPAPAVAPPHPARGGWSVQAGFFANRDHAETLVRQLKGEGFTAQVSMSGRGAAARYRVRLGPYAERAAAAEAIAKLQAHRHTATLVPPGA